MDDVQYYISYKGRDVNSFYHLLTHMHTTLHPERCSVHIHSFSEYTNDCTCAWASSHHLSSDITPSRRFHVSLRLGLEPHLSGPSAAVLSQVCGSVSHAALGAPLGQET